MLGNSSAKSRSVGRKATESSLLFSFCFQGKKEILAGCVDCWKDLVGVLVRMLCNGILSLFYYWSLSPFMPSRWDVQYPWAGGQTKDNTFPISITQVEVLKDRVGRAHAGWLFLKQSLSSARLWLISFHTHMV